MRTLISTPSLIDWLIYFRQLPAEALKEIKDAINAPENLRIVPTLVHEQVVIKPLFLLAITATNEEICFRNRWHWSNHYLFYEFPILNVDVFYYPQVLQNILNELPSNFIASSSNLSSQMTEPKGRRVPGNIVGVLF